MKYYAVTDDPNELMHYGILGMKWGVLRTPEQLGHRKPPKSTNINPKKVKSMLFDYQKGSGSRKSPSYNHTQKPKSDAYISASDKLRKMMRSGINKAHANWKKHNSPESKSERLFEKHVQLARQGRLKYKGISDDEVKRITNRLAIERDARNLSGAEKQSFARRLRSSIGDGVVSGIGQGVAARVSERISRGGRLKTQRMQQEQSNRIAREERRVLQREADRNIKREAQREIDKEYYKMAAEQGIDTGLIGTIRNSRVNVDAFGRPTGLTLASNATRSGRAKALRDYNDAEDERKRIKENEAWGRDLRRKQFDAYYTQRARNLALNDYPVSKGNDVKTSGEVKDIIDKKRQKDMQRATKEQLSAQREAAKARVKEQAKATGNDKPHAYTRPHGNWKKREQYRHNSRSR